MQENEEPDLRVPVAEHLQGELRLYRRLWLTRVDLEEAAASLEEILRRRIAIPRRQPPPPLLMSLTTALVVAYARPWVQSRGSSSADRTAPGSLLRNLTSRQRAVHNYLIEHRNKDIAHSDADIVELHVRLIPGGDAAILRNFREAFTRRDLIAIRGIIKKIERSVEQRCQELRLVLPLCQWM
jgi:hypothetical protein